MLFNNPKAALGYGYLIKNDQIKQLYRQNPDKYYKFINDNYAYMINSDIDSDCFFGQIEGIVSQEKSVVSFTQDYLQKEMRLDGCGLRTKLQNAVSKYFNKGFDELSYYLLYFRP